LNELTKEQAVTKILETLPLEKILSNEALLDKLKVLILPKIECPTLKFLFANSTDFNLIYGCYSNPRYFRDLITHMKCSEWKYIIIMAADYQMAVTEEQVHRFVGNGKSYGVISFSLDQINESKLLKLWKADGEPDEMYQHVKWYEF
jgi:hypothetical protein